MNDQIKKKQGPVRKGAVIPFLVFLALISLFNLFFLDSTIKNSIEYVSEKVNRAEVNVGSVNSSLLDLKITIKNIQFTDKEKPEFNTFSIGTITVKLLWDALLRGKFVIDLAKVGDVKIKSKRTKAGYIIPVVVNEEGDTPQEVETKKAFKKVEKEFEGNVFGDIAGVLAGGSTGDISNNVSQNLESKKKFEELTEKITRKEKELGKQFESLPSKSDLNKLQVRFQKIPWKDLGNILKAPKVLKEADSVNKDLNKALKSYDELNKNLNKSLTEIDKDYKEAEKLIGTDIASVKKRMNLPSLDQNSIARALFGQDILGKVEKAREYQNIAKEYMPPKKEEDEPKSIPRRNGKDYQFGKPNSYPLFWLKLAQINSENEQGSVVGRIENVTNDQKIIGKLTTAQGKGDFAPLEIRNVDFKLEVDHRNKPIANIKGSIGSMKIKNKALSRSKETKFILADSNMKTNFNGLFTGEKATLKINSEFNQITYDVDSNNSTVKEVLKDVAQKTKTLTCLLYTSPSPRD